APAANHRNQTTDYRDDHTRPNQVNRWLHTHSNNCLGWIHWQAKIVHTSINQALGWIEVYQRKGVTARQGCWHILERLIGILGINYHANLWRYKAFLALVEHAHLSANLGLTCM